MSFTKVKSSMISEVAYDEAAAVMHVKFPNGKQYSYFGVTPKQHQELMKAESIGKHFGAHVRGKFEHKMVEAAK
ncbi:KTSC domain-containing protein [Methylosinus sp. PW1]|uniref:KTSC domain-containing protein n=1 Tax=Methylosinus sp. PW1 TaxID=107636 RepID=UPI000565F9CB|nr:KTSC domain-containing protein [Methylosinus sp. PW1]